MTAYTLADLVRSLRAYVGNDVTEFKSAACRRAAVEGVRKLASYENWVYYQTIGRLYTVASQTDGTVEYDHTGGANERQVTLTDGTWPSWIAYGEIKIGNYVYDVDTRVSDTIITLGVNSNPSEDVDAGTSYAAFRTRYPMPDDFVSLGQPISAIDGCPISVVSAEDFVFSRNRNESPGTPRWYALMGRPDGAGGTDILLWPPSDTARQLEYLYRRKPALPVIEDESAGRVSLTASSAAVVGFNTNFSQRHVGCVFRASYDQTAPTSEAGPSPYAFQSRILSVESATAVTLETAATTSLAKVAHQTSSPIDVEDGPMWNLLVELCRLELRKECRINVTNEEVAHYKEAAQAARSANGTKIQERQQAGQQGGYRRPGPIPRHSC